MRVLLGCVMLVAMGCSRDEPGRAGDAAAIADGGGSRIAERQGCAPCGEGERCVGVACVPGGSLAMSLSHTCHLSPSGRVRCWGANRVGEIGDGTHLMRDRPVFVKGIADAVQLAVRRDQTCVRRRSGAVTCWGRTFGAWKEQLEPTDVDALRGVVDIALSDDVFCGLRSEGSIICLPRNKRDKALRAAGPPPGQPVPDALDLAASPGSLCAIRRGGTVTCWKMNPHEEIPAAERQRTMEGVTGAVSLLAGGATVCALSGGGRATCWGGGIATTAGGMRDTMLYGPHDFGSIGAAVDLAFLGWPHDQDCAIRASGQVICWPPPYLDPPTEPITIQPKVVGMPPAYQIEAVKHDDSYCALTRDDEVYCWGNRSAGRLGSGRSMEQPSPKVIAGVKSPTRVVASDGFACAKTAAGRLYCWGGNQPVHQVKAAGLERLLSGRCASIDGELQCFAEPFEKRLPASGLHNVKQLVGAGSGSHLLAYWVLHGDGKVSHVEWKRRAAKWSLEDASPVAKLASVRRLSRGGQHTCAYGKGNEIRCWRQISEIHTVKPPAGLAQLLVTRLLGDGRHEGCGVQGGKVGCWDLKGELSWFDDAGVVQLRGNDRGTRCSLASGTLACWSSGLGLTGHGSLNGSPQPKPVPSLEGVVDFSFAQKSFNGGEAVYAWLRDGRLLAWGVNHRGQLGWVGIPRIATPTKVEAGP